MAASQVASPSTLAPVLLLARRITFMALLCDSRSTVADDVMELDLEVFDAVARPASSSTVLLLLLADPMPCVCFKSVCLAARPSRRSCCSSCASSAACRIGLITMSGVNGPYGARLLSPLTKYMCSQTHCTGTVMLSCYTPAISFVEQNLAHHSVTCPGVPWTCS